jgi:hypothetical protein
MKTSFRLFLGLALFYFILAATYFFAGGEVVGITALALSGGLAGLVVGFHMCFQRIMLSLKLQTEPVSLVSSVRTLGGLCQLQLSSALLGWD